jgi:hypothetical protein
MYFLITFNINVFPVDEKVGCWVVLETLSENLTLATQADCLN